MPIVVLLYIILKTIEKDERVYTRLNYSTDKNKTIYRKKHTKY